MAAETVLAVHGGAGDLLRERWSDERDVHARSSLADALRAGQTLLEDGRPALEAVEAAVRVLEAEPFWNAGRGSVLTSAGTVECDAAIMDGRDRRVGAVSAVRDVAHPITLARHVMADGRHVLLTMDGAEAFADACGVARVAPQSLVTEQRQRQLERALGRVARDHDLELGTVGAVARDRDGHLAAATSTGGLTGQAPGRVGDSPIPGAGTWADDATAAISGTGHGEAYLRCAFAHEIDAQLRFAGASIGDACQAALDLVATLGSTGGVIAIDAAGRVALPCTTSAMFRGVVRGAGAAEVAIFEADAPTAVAVR